MPKTTRKAIRLTAAGLAILVMSACPRLSYQEAYWNAEIVDPQRSVRGVILFLHGCNGMREGKTARERFWPWQEQWVRHLTAAGFRVVAPDSFADPRPPASCQAPYPDKEAIYRLRLRQTIYAIEESRRQHPNLPLFIWGHSEGAGVANLVNLPVDGIITTGYQCGFRSTLATEILATVPLIAFQGTGDRYIAEVRTNTGLTLDEMCDRVFLSPQWRHVVVQGMGHSAPLAEPSVREELDRFLNSVPGTE